MLATALLIGCTGGATGTAEKGSPSESDEPLVVLENPIELADRTEQAGIGFVQTNGVESGLLTILESLGSGVGVADFDRDGWNDICLPGGGTFRTVGSSVSVMGKAPGVFRNLGNWRFEDVTGPARFGNNKLYSHGVAIADYDNDGFCDIALTGYQGVQLYHNQGDGTFQRAARGRLAILMSDWKPAGCSSAGWGDVDGDGWVDLYVARYTNWSPTNNPACKSFAGTDPDVCPPAMFQGLPDALWLNRGNGQFMDASERVAIDQPAKGLGVVLADLDNDSDLEIYVANDANPNALFSNDGQGQLNEIGFASGTALSDRFVADGSMGISVGDVDDDGLFDLVVSNFEDQGLALYRNEGGNFFQYTSGSMGLAAVSTVAVGFGTTLADFNRDSHDDLFVTNGHVMYASPNSPLEQLPQLFQNDGGRRFVEISQVAGQYLVREHVGRGSAAADLDRDGDPDLVVTHQNAHPAVLENVSSNDHHWLKLVLVGTTSNRDAIGARIEFRIGTERRFRCISGGGSYLSAAPYHCLLGLGGATRIDELVVNWPSGIRQVLEDVVVDRELIVVEPPQAE